MEHDSEADLATAPPLPDGRPTQGGPRRGGRGGGLRRGPRSVSEARWQSLRRLIVTVGDDVCLVPTQIISLSQAISDSIIAEREERRDTGGVGDRGNGEEGAPGPRPSSLGPDGLREGEEGRSNGGGDEKGGAAMNLETKVVNLIVDCAARLPVKTGIYSALVGLLFRKARLRGLVGQLVSSALSRFEASLMKGLFSEAKLLLRFFLGLASSYVLALGPVIGVIKALLQMSNDLPQTTAEHAAHTAMSALPWLSVKMYEAHHSSLVEVLDCPNTKPDRETALLLSAIQPFTGSLASFAPEGAPAGAGGPSTDGGPQEGEEGNAAPTLVPTDRLASLLDAIDSMIDAEWHSRSTLRFYQSSELLPLLSAEGPGAPPLLDLPPLSVGASDLRGVRVPPLDAVLRLPATLEHVDVPLQAHDQWILEDHFLTTLRHFISNISLCAEQLLRIPVDHPQFEYVLVECIFSEMLRLPRSPQIRGASGAPFAYTRLLQRLCQLQNSLGQVVEVLIGSLVRRAIDMDHEILLTLTDFFGYWLNAWGGPSKLLEEWLGVARAPPQTKLIVKLALEKAMRINYPDALALAIPECARDLRPPRAVAENPYLCLTPAPPGGPPGASSADAEAAGGTSGAPQGGGAPLGLVEFSLLRQMLRFSFEREEAKKESVLGVYKLLMSLLGRRKSKGPLGGAPRKERESDAPQDAGGEGGMETDTPAAETPAAAASANGSSSPAGGETAAAAADETAADAAAETEKEGGAMETEGEGQQQTDLSPLEHCEKDTESPPWDIEETLKLFVYCLFALGSKTQTHIHRLLTNYAEVFALIENNEVSMKEDETLPHADQQVDIHPPVLQALQKYWTNSQQKMALSLHALLKVGILKRSRVLQLLCAADTEARDSWAHLELVQTILRGAIDNCETAKEEAAAAGAPIPPPTEAEELLHCYLTSLLADLKAEEAPARKKFLFLRCMFIGRKYAEYIDLSRLREEVEGGDDPRVQSLLTIVKQIRRQFYFMDEEQTV